MKNDKRNKDSKLPKLMYLRWATRLTETPGQARVLAAVRTIHDFSTEMFRVKISVEELAELAYVLIPLLTEAIEWLDNRGLIEVNPHDATILIEAPDGQGTEIRLCCVDPIENVDDEDEMRERFQALQNLCEMLALAPGSEDDPKLAQLRRELDVLGIDCPELTRELDDDESDP